VSFSLTGIAKAAPSPVLIALKDSDADVRAYARRALDQDG
jgi:hypothetical protein